MASDLSEAVKKVLERAEGDLKQKAKLSSGTKPLPQENKPYMSEKAQRALAQKPSLTDEVKRLLKEGVGIRAISRTLQINRATVRKYLQMEVALPKRSPSQTKIFYMRTIFGMLWLPGAVF
jgi:DNA-binding NarL/FixJ family response regulator